MEKNKGRLPIKTYNGLRKTKKAVTSEDVIPEGLPFISADTKDLVTKNFGLGEYAAPTILWQGSIGVSYKFPYLNLRDIVVSELKIWYQYAPNLVEQLAMWVGGTYRGAQEFHESGTIGGAMILTSYRQQMGFDFVTQMSELTPKDLLPAFEQCKKLPEDTMFSRAQSNFEIPTYQVHLKEIVQHAMDLSPSEISTSTAATATYQVLEKLWRRSV